MMRAQETIGLTPVYPAKIIPIHLADVNSVVVRKQSYMCGIGNVDISMSLDCCSPTCCLAGVGIVRQQISGDGVAFLQVSPKDCASIQARGCTISASQLAGGR